MPPKFQFDVFLSHSSKDKTIVRALAERMQKDGIKVWFDEWEIVPGDNIPAKIDEGLERSRVLVLCMSANAFGSDWTELETCTKRFKDPLNKERRFIPLRLDTAPIKDSLAQFRYVNWLPEGQDREYGKLLKACRSSMSLAGSDLGEPRDDGRKDPSHERKFEMAPPPSDVVQPLHLAEDRFLQILLSKFTLARREKASGSTFELSAEFDDSTLAIWDQSGKRYLREVLPKDKCERFQVIFDEFFSARGPDLLEVDDPDFFFRYASGGTLVEVEFEDDIRPNRFYCLFYRDVHPIGWNIANGATDTRAELLNPQETINRELREELIIADFISRERYVFDADVSKPFDHAAHAAARRLWKRKFPDRDLNALKAVPVNIKPYQGSDSLRIRMGHDREVKQSGFYLNINGRDFGIEFDCVATIRGLPRHVTLFDGEVDGGRLVDCPVGLFEVERFNQRLRLGEVSFVPDFFYFGDKRHDNGSEVTKILETHFIEHVRSIRMAKEIEELKAAIKDYTHLALCPVTRRIAARYYDSKPGLA